MVAAKSARFLAGSIVVAVVSACSVRDSVSSAVYTPGFGGCKASSGKYLKPSPIERLGLRGH